MKYYYYYFYCNRTVAEIALIVKLFAWLAFVIDSVLCWSQYFAHIFLHFLQRTQMPKQQMLYTFRPFELTRIEYKSYSKRMGGGGINMYPKERSGHRIAMNDTDIFCFGGFNPEIQSPHLFCEFWKFNLLTQRWSRIFNDNTENMPDELVSNAVAIRDDVMLVYGGTGFPFGEKSSNKCSLLYPYAMPKQIELLETSGTKPEPQYGQAIMLHDRYLYAIGGTTGHEYTCDIYRLDLSSRIWECIYICNDILRDDDPKGRYRHEVVHDGTHIYILGGGTRECTFDLESLPAFDLTLNKWTSIKTKPDPHSNRNGGYPEPRKFHSCVQQNTDDGIEVIIAGGFKTNVDLFDDIWKLNLRTYQWTRYAQTKLPHKLHFHDATIANNGCMYIFGGISGSRNNHLHKMWLRIPKLSDMCWEALQVYNPALNKIEKSTLLQVGVPQKYAAQVDRAKAVVYDF